jgi:hypothetical protein
LPRKKLETHLSDFSVVFSANASAKIFNLSRPTVPLWDVEDAPIAREVSVLFWRNTLAKLKNESDEMVLLSTMKCFSELFVSYKK